MTDTTDPGQPAPATTDDGYRVMHTGVFGWTVCHGPNLDFARTADGGFAIGYRTAEDAHAAINDTPANDSHSHHDTDTDTDTDGM